MYRLIFIKLPLDVFQFGQSNIVLILSAISSCNLFKGSQRVLSRLIDNKIKRRFLDVEDK